MDGDGRPDAHRSAWRRDERIRANRPVLRAFAHRAAWHWSGRVQNQHFHVHVPAGAVRRTARGGCHYGDRTFESAYWSARPRRTGHDWRGDAARQSPPIGGVNGTYCRQPTGRVHGRHRAEAQRAGPSRRTRIGPRGGPHPPGQHGWEVLSLTLPWDVASGERLQAAAWTIRLACGGSGCTRRILQPSTSYPQ